MHHFLLRALLLLVSLKVAVAFDFIFKGNLTQCDNFTVQWSAGTAPYRFSWIPILGVPQNISIPTTSTNSFTTQLTYPTGTQVLGVMSDSTGFGTGGVSQLLTVGSSRGGQCSPSLGTVAFVFDLNTPLQQCRPYTFSGYDGAIQPVTIYGVIPGGDTLVLHPPTGSSTFNWTANVVTGTSIVFFMVDSQGHQGGASQVQVVGSSSDRTCLGSSTPSSTQTASRGSTMPSSTDNPSADSTNSTGAAAGGSVAGVVILMLLLCAFCNPRRKVTVTKTSWW